MAEQYSFSREFQLEILGAMLSEQLLSTFHDCFIVDYFSENDVREIAARILKVFESTGMPPSRTTLKEELKATSLKEVVNTIPAVKNKQAVMEKITTFARKQAVKNAMREGTQDLIEGNYDSIADRIAIATEVGRGHGDLGLLHGEFADGPPTLDTGTPIPTGLTGLDVPLRGGFKPKRLYTVTGLSGSGKSQMLVNFAYAAIAAGKNVLYVSCELTKHEVGQRFEQRISQIDDISYVDDFDIVKSRVEEFYAKNGNLIIKESPPGEINCKDIEYLVDRIAKKMFKIDMIVTDYGDEMSSTIRHSGDAKTRLEQGQIWRDHKIMAVHLNLPVVTACQSNAGGYGSDLLGMQNAAESQTKPRVSDVWMTLNQDPEESMQNQLRIYIDKNRTGPRGVTAVVRVDHARCTIKDKGH